MDKKELFESLPVPVALRKMIVPPPSVRSLC